MAGHTVKVKLPDALYERARQVAEAMSRTMDDILAQSIALALPPVEEDLPPAVRSQLMALPLMGDEELWRLAKRPMSEEKQARLEALVEAGKKRQLSPEEESALAELMEEAQGVMLRRAEVYRVLAQRGHEVFPHSSVSAD